MDPEDENCRLLRNLYLLHDTHEDVLLAIVRILPFKNRSAFRAACRKNLHISDLAADAITFLQAPTITHECQPRFPNVRNLFIVLQQSSTGMLLPLRTLSPNWFAQLLHMELRFVVCWTSFAIEVPFLLSGCQSLAMLTLSSTATRGHDGATSLLPGCTASMQFTLTQPWQSDLQQLFLTPMASPQVLTTPALKQHLESLTITSHDILAADTAAVEEFTAGICSAQHLTYLKIHGVKLSHVTQQTAAGMSSLTRLQQLCIDLSDMPPTSPLWTGLGYITCLQYLQVKHHGIWSLSSGIQIPSSWSRLQSLQSLHIQAQNVLQLNHLSTLTTLTYLSMSLATESDLCFIANMNRLDNLFISYPNEFFYEGFIPELPQTPMDPLPQLTSASILCPSPHLYPIIANLTVLTRLQLELLSSLDTTHLSCLTSLTSLLNLTLSRFHLDLNIPQWLNSLTSLRSLTVTYRPSFDSLHPPVNATVWCEDLDTLIHLPHLHTLAFDFEGLPGCVSRSEIIHWNMSLDCWLASIIAPNLQRLSFGGDDVFDDGVGETHAAIVYSTLQALRQRSPGLQLLSIVGSVSVSVDDETLDDIDLQVMNTLQLACQGGDACSDDGIEGAVQRAGARLRALRLWSWEYDVAELTAELADIVTQHCTQLTQLHIGAQYVSGRCLRKLLAACPLLVSLKLRQLTLVDKATLLDVLNASLLLREVWVDGCHNMDDEVVARFATLPHLEVLGLQKCVSVSSAGVKALLWGGPPMLRLLSLQMLPKCDAEEMKEDHKDLVDEVVHGTRWVQGGYKVELDGVKIIDFSGE